MRKMRLKKTIMVSILSFSMLCGNTSWMVSDVSAKENDVDKSNIDNSNEVVRIMVELENDSVADKNEDISEYTDKLAKQEDKIIEEQDDIVEKIENITGNKAINRCAYLVNAFSIEAKKDDIDKISDVQGVKNVEQAPTIQVPIKEDNEKIEEINEVVEEVKQTNSSKYDGEGSVVAIIDSGFNITHPDMKIDNGVKTKFTKEQWLDKINELGYGDYLSDKFPFGYDYYDGDTNIDGYEHGMHVSGIIGANGKKMGVLPNAQLVGMKIGSDTGSNICYDGVFKALEDATKLDVDAINISFGRKMSIDTTDDMFNKVLKKVHDTGIFICCACANSGIYGSYSNQVGSHNYMGIHDITTISSDSVYDGCMSVANAYVPGVSMDDDDYKQNLLAGCPKENLDLNNVMMASSSSWGCPMDLSINPEITTPGERILSTGKNDSYLVMDGTSMAAPYMTGLSVKEIMYLRQKDYNFKNIKINDLAKIMLMNTADIIYDRYHLEDDRNIPYAVRYQGAGLCNIDKALNNEVSATYNGKAGIELGETTKNDISIEIVLTNYGRKDATYKLNDMPLYNSVIDTNTFYYMQPIDNACVKFKDKQVTVKAGKTKKVKANVIIPKDLKKDQFVEGYVKLEGVNVESLSMPLLSFYGDWNNEAIFDKSLYEDEKGTSVLCDENGIVYGSYNNSDKIAFSPNDDGVSDIVKICPNLIRDTNELDVYILDSDGETIRTLDKYQNLKKNESQEMPYSVKYQDQNDIDSCHWDGKIFDTKNNQYYVASEGQYYIKICAKTKKDASFQSITFPIKVDVSKPTASTNIKKENEDIYLVLSANDNIGLDDSFKINTMYSSQTIKYSDCDYNNNTYIYNLSKANLDKKKITIDIFDMAGNTTSIEEQIEDGKEETVPIDNPNPSTLKESLIIDYSVEGVNILQNNTSNNINGYYIEETDEKTKIRFKVDEGKTTSITFGSQNLENFNLSSYDVKKDDFGYYYDGTISNNEIYMVICKSENKSEVVYFYLSDDFERYQIVMTMMLGIKVVDVSDYIKEDNLDLSVADCCLKKEDLSKDNEFVAKGKLSDKIKKFTINGKEVTLNNDMTFEEKIKMSYGKTRIVYKFEDINGIVVDVCKTYYYDDLKIYFDNCKFEKDEILYTIGKTFNLKGMINSYFNTYGMKINGNSIKVKSGGYRTTLPDTIFNNKFEQKIELNRGLNTITIDVEDVTGKVVTKNIRINRIL